ncbi:MAG TPA: hypothetical protein PKE62_16275 [Anaerolineales bacterium]|nr:hypothetical protein [Anaerolineales bacterium]
MSVNEDIIKRFDELIEKGRKVLSTRRDLPSNYIGFDDPVDSEMGNQWMVSSKNYLLQTIGEKSVHFTEFSALFKKGVTFSPVKKGIGILSAAKEDFQGGYLLGIRKLVSAEIMGSLLDQAQELLDAGYLGSAAVLVGCILEDRIKKICAEKEIELPDKPKLDYMNAQLAKIEYYNKLTQKQVTAWAEIRNSAAHGNWENFKEDDVKDMIKWVSRFIETGG